jgi:MerR family mercuric resistance operon transcriptional regulator
VQKITNPTKAFLDNKIFILQITFLKNFKYENYLRITIFNSLLTLELRPECIIYLMSESALQIGEISKRADVSIDTVRYYEKRKLIHSVSRTYGGFRLFKPHTVEQIKFIKQAQEFGFSLDEIQGLLGSGSADECQQVRDLLQQKISEVDEQIKKMKSFKKTLSNHLKACDDELNQNGQKANCPAFFEIKRGK